jgi:hypothetical protein
MAIQYLIRKGRGGVGILVFTRQVLLFWRDARLARKLELVVAQLNESLAQARSTAKNNEA